MKDQKEVNKRQKEFYQSFKKNFATKLWFSLRNGILTNFRKSVGIEGIIINQHAEWIGDLKGKKVLDLGCFIGNSLSMYLAENAAEYVAIDLSDNAVQQFNRRLKHIPSANAYAVDFLAEEFKENDFDLIYAYAVLHHFKDVDGLIKRLNEKLSDKGRIINYDPTKTSLPVRLARSLYRPFQSDRDWEWPFDKKTIRKFENSFNILERHGILGKSKWFFLLNLLPIGEKKRIEIGRKWLKEDWEKSRISDERLYSCMQLTMFMEKKK
ncbi:class I SAM-dependent methyltransferase [Gramella jeungdoensis]|uniref:Class I SAM-dependent methyltransferase n=1 Tax=Gramella jeungdoensis TaxID=708091 RepID=A0ABT0Z0I1_9FLAO|nr:class I SAM-dependent methyltransferase [Gramella jeungdoensis]MCM8569225.1 class I SAM-dependent methyltransferase [Gramella jeungdoensis]